MEKIISGIIIKDKRILLLKRWKDVKTAPNLWCLPWWHLEEWESNEQAVIREVKEEVGLDFIPERLYKEVTENNMYFHYIWQAKWKIIVDENESDWYWWFSYIEALQLPMMHRIKLTLHSLIDDWLIK